MRDGNLGLYKRVTSTEITCVSIRIINQLQKTKTGIYNTSIMYEHSTEAGKGNTKRDCCKVLYSIHGLGELKVDDTVEGQALTHPLKHRKLQRASQQRRKCSRKRQKKSRNKELRRKQVSRG